MTLVVGVATEFCNFIYADTAVTTSDDLVLEGASKLGRLNSYVIYGIAGDPDSANEYLEKLRAILPEKADMKEDELRDSLKLSVADVSSYRAFEIILSAFAERDHLIYVNSEGVFIKYSHGEIVAIGSGAKSSILQELEKDASLYKEEEMSLANIGIAILRVLNEWTIGRRSMSAPQFKFGGTFFYLVQNQGKIHFPTPTLNLVARLDGDILIVDVSGAIYIDGAILWFRPHAGERKIFLSNMDMNFLATLKAYRDDPASLMRVYEQKFYETEFRAVTAYHESVLLTGPIRPPIKFGLEPKFEISPEIDFWLSKIHEKTSYKRVRFVI